MSAGSRYMIGAVMGLLSLLLDLVLERANARPFDRRRPVQFVASRRAHCVARPKTAFSCWPKAVAESARAPEWFPPVA